MIDKDIEKNRYDDAAELLIKANKFNQVVKTLKYINVPYEFYFEILNHKNKQSKLLEIGAGTGHHTASLIDMSYNVCATDISLKSVEFLKKRFYGYKNFSAQYADMEKLPFNNESFDIICGTGVLSYGDNKKVMNTYPWKMKNNINDIVNDVYEWMYNNHSKLKKFL